MRARCAGPNPRRGGPRREPSALARRWPRRPRRPVPRPSSPTFSPPRLGRATERSSRAMAPFHPERMTNRGPVLSHAAGMSLGRVSAVIAAVALFGAACGGSGSGDVSTVDAAEARVTSSQKAVNTAQTKFDDSKSTFCANTKTYITAVDRYGKAFEKTAATVGDMKAAGADLVKPREAVQSSAQTVVDARDALAK